MALEALLIEDWLYALRPEVFGIERWLFLGLDEFGANGTQEECAHEDKR
jgi:hypothetical protein